MSRTEPAQAAPFRRGVVVALAAIALASLVSAFLFGIYGDPVPASAGANTFSRSAIGHNALLLLLEERGVPHVVSRWHSAERARDGDSLLVVLEPTGLDYAPERGEALAEMVSAAPTTLVVLPKRVGRPSESDPEHVESVDFVRESELHGVLDALGLSEASVGFHEEPAAEVRWRGTAHLGLGAPAPTVDELQVVLDPSGTLESLVSTADGGIFLGRFETERGHIVWLLSDPDLLQTHGLVRGENEAVAAALLDTARAPGRTVVIDETLHGFELAPSLARELGTFPLGLAVLQVLLVVVGVVWAGMLRFGGARPQPVGAAAHSALEPFEDASVPGASGALALVESTAAVLSRSSHGGSTLFRYLLMAEREVATALNAPSLRNHEELVDWLEQAEQARGVGESLRALREDANQLSLERRARAASVVELAERIHRWKQEILHPSAPGRAARGPAHGSGQSERSEAAASSQSRQSSAG